MSPRTQNVFNWTIQTANGSVTYADRARHQVLLDADGELSHVYGGVRRDSQTDFTLTAVQPVHTSKTLKTDDSGADLQCLTAISAAGDLDPSSATVNGVCSGRSAADSSFVCGGVGNRVKTLAAKSWLGRSDFTVEMEIMLEVVNGTAASVVFVSPETGGDGENFIGLDGVIKGQHGMFVGWPQPIGSKIEPNAPLPTAGDWFNLTLARKHGVLSVFVHGMKTFTVPMQFAVQTVALRPWRSRIHARKLTLCAPQLPALGAPPPPPPVVFTPGEAGIPIYRIPALCAAGPALVAFAEGREKAGGDFAIKRNMVKRSLDSGSTWSKAEVVPGTWQAGWCVGQPTCAYDPARKLLVLQYQNSTTHRQVNGVTMQVISEDNGATWQAPTILDPFMGKFKGTFPGPGVGLVLSKRSKNPGRYVFASWGVAGKNIYDIVSFSDDAGKTYTVSKSHYPANLTGVFEEPSVAETQSGDVLLNMRMGNDAAACGGTHCRFSALSTDGGASFTPAVSVPKLVSPGCQGSVMLHPPSNRILFSGPFSGKGRVNGTLMYNEDSGAADSWRAQSILDGGAFAYSCLALLPTGAAGGVNASHVAVLYEGHSGQLFLARPAVKSDDPGADLQRRLDAAAAAAQPLFVLPQGNVQFTQASPSLQVHAATNLKVAGHAGGTTLLFPLGGGLRVHNSVNISLQGFSIDYFPFRPYIQMKIIAMAPADTDAAPAPSPTPVGKRPAPPCPLGWWLPAGSQLCDQGCPSGAQARNATSGRCLCAEAAPNNKCLAGETCVGGQCSDPPPGPPPPPAPRRTRYTLELANLSLPVFWGDVAHGVLWHGVTNRSKHEGVPSPGGAQRIGGAGSRTYAWNASVPGAVVGDYMTFAGRDNYTVVVANSSRCTMSDVVILSASGFAITEIDGAGGHRYHRVRIGSHGAGMQPSSGQPLLVGANADALHSVDVEIGPELVDCDFSGNCDDFINVHSTLHVMFALGNPPGGAFSIIDPRIPALGKTPLTGTDLWYGTSSPLANSRAGDTLSCFVVNTLPRYPGAGRWKSFARFVLRSAPEAVRDAASLAEAALVRQRTNNASANPPLMAWKTLRLWSVDLRTASGAPPPPLPASGSVICDVDRFGGRGATLTNNSFHDLGTNGGIRWKSSNSAIIGNRITHAGNGSHAVGTAHTGVEVSALQDWMEGPATIENVLIAHNEWIDCGLTASPVTVMKQAENVSMHDNTWSTPLKTDDLSAGRCNDEPRLHASRG